MFLFSVVLAAENRNISTIELSASDIFAVSGALPPQIANISDRDPCADHGMSDPGAISVT
jgi:hypothetical protein